MENHTTKPDAFINDTTTPPIGTCIFTPMSETYQSKQERRQRLPRAIEQLRADADTSFADLLDPPSQPLTATFLQTIVDKEI